MEKVDICRLAFKMACSPIIYIYGGFKSKLGDNVLLEFTTFCLLPYKDRVSFFFSFISFNRSWRISTTPNTTNFFILFKLLQHRLLDRWSFEVASRRKIEIWTQGKKKFTLLLKREVCGYFWLENATFKGQLNSE